tara:strand:- start:933 stop:1766 length:834 start_codon:yes stop_codon:yes gene_type:complete
MKKPAYAFVFFLLWGLVNWIFLEWIPEKSKESEARMDPEIVERFERISLQVQTPYYNVPIPFQARLLKPDNPDVRRLYPLIVFLHGAGENGNDNQRQLKYLPQQMAQSHWQEKYPCFLLAPQCPHNMNWSSPARAADSPEDKNQNLLDQIQQIILDISSKYPVDTRRIYITGYSMGGFGTWSMIARYPELFASAVPICGGGDPDTVSLFVHLPIWVAHGTLDQIVPVTRSRDMVAAFHKAGGDPIYQELDGVKHDSWTSTYAFDSGMFAWMFQQRKN